MKKGALIFSVSLALGCLVSCSNGKTHTVLFKNDDADKTILQECEVDDNGYATYTGPTPTKERDEYEYVFSNFYPNPSETPVLFDMTFTAIFVPITNKIIWLNDDGTLLHTDFNVTIGEMPVYDGPEPEKEGATFIGWTPEVVPATGDDACYIAVFDEPEKEHKLDLISTNEEFGTTDGSGIYLSGTPVTATAIPNDGYAFVGWYYDEECLGPHVDEEIYTFDMPNNDVTAYAKFDIAHYKINYELDGGTNHEDNPDTYTMFEEADIIFKDPTREGYTFKGWVDEQGGQTKGIPMGSHGDKTVTAVWEANRHKVTTHYDSKYGDAKGDGVYGFDENVNILVYPNNGYKFEGWYDNEAFSGTPLSTEEEYTFSMPDKDVDLYAKFSIINYTITYDYDGGTEVENKTSYTVEDESFTFNDPTKEHYTFTGWMNKETGEIMTGVTQGSFGDLDLVAQWEINKCNVILYNNNEKWGTVEGAGKYDFGSEVTIKAAANENRNFLGWYSDEEHTTLVTEEPSYTFTLEEEKTYEFYALFEEHDKAWKIEHGVIPTKQDDNIITYGMYPQTVVTDTKLIKALDGETVSSETGYIYYEDEYYAKLTASPYSNDYYFSDGTTKVQANKTYYFKCEKLQWYFMKINDEYTLDSAYVLTKQAFDSSTNIYKNSSLRKYLNETFYEQAFMLDKSYTAQKKIYKDELENSYIAAYDTYTEKYSGQAYKPVSDYALAQGVQMTENEGYRCGPYWSRSQSEETSGYVYAIGYDGWEIEYLPNCSYVGLSPAIQLKDFE